MKMPHRMEIVGWAVTAVVTGSTVATLHEHHVSLLTTLAVFGAMLSAGMTLTGHLVKASTTHVYRCAAEGCSVEIRATDDHTLERLAVLEDLATDHARHGSVRA